MMRASKFKSMLALLSVALAIAIVAGIAQAVAPSNDVEKPTLPPRTPIAGANKGGLFGDGVVNVPKVDTSGWKTYSNARYGYSFKYPPNWALDERDNAGHHGPNGEPSYPLQEVTVANPLEDQGKNLPGTNCQGSGCNGAGPNALGFDVRILNALCNIPGDLIVIDTFAVNGKQGSRCVLQSQGDKITRATSIGFPLGDGTNFIEVLLQRGRAVSPQEQAILETILSTFTINKGSTP
jgi:hypothetical protein